MSYHRRSVEECRQALFDAALRFADVESLDDLGFHLAGRALCEAAIAYVGVRPQAGTHETRPVRQCLVCGRVRPIAAKDKCEACYRRERRRAA